MSRSLTRRGFLRTGGALAAAAIVAPSIGLRVLGANERLGIAGIGVGGKGESDIGLCASEDIVALCDVDLRQARRSFERFPDATRYRDFRKMLDAEDKRIDAVTVSTPDHVHAVAALAALRRGKHVHCQKPLTHSVEEARRLREVARASGLATQMGNQGHCAALLRRMVELVRGGVLGPVHEVHTWTNRPIWPQGIDRPTGTPPVPEELQWDLWLGPAPQRPYHEAYVPFRWRGFRDFGTGALGDMGCHIIDLPFWALELDAPVRVEAESSETHAETYPSWSVIHYEFAARGDRPPVKLHWYDGGKKPAKEIVAGFKGVDELTSNGVIFVGKNDTLYHARAQAGRAHFASGARLEDFSSIPETLPRRPGAEKEDNVDREHRREWIEACKGGPAALSNFEYAGPLTETVLLGNVALLAGEGFEWDARALRVPSSPRAEKLLRGCYRSGWELERV